VLGQGNLRTTVCAGGEARTLFYEHYMKAGRKTLSTVFTAENHVLEDSIELKSRQLPQTVLSGANGPSKISTGAINITTQTVVMIEKQDIRLEESIRCLIDVTVRLTFLPSQCFWRLTYHAGSNSANHRGT